MEHNRKDIEESIRNWIETHTAYEGEGPLDAKADLIEATSMDSLKIADLLAHCEQAFQVTFPGAAINPENLSSIETVTELILSLSES